jgi:hypothetical protein
MGNLGLLVWFVRKVLKNCDQIAEETRVGKGITWAMGARRWRMTHISSAQYDEKFFWGKYDKKKSFWRNMTEELSIYIVEK